MEKCSIGGTACLNAFGVQKLTGCLSGKKGHGNVFSPMGIAIKILRKQERGIKQEMSGD